MFLRVLACSCIIALLSSSARSQEAHKGAKGDVYAGYSRIAPNFGTRSLGGPGENGFNVGGDVNLLRYLAITAESDWYSVTYGSQLSSSTYTALAGGRAFYPTAPHARVTLLADVLAGAANFTRITGTNSPFTADAAFAMAADGGVELRVIGPLGLRVQGGLLHSGYKARYPQSDSQSSLHREHGRLLVAGVWHF